MPEEIEGNEAEVIVCAGPPLCSLEGDKAIQNSMDGCPLCQRHVLQPDGTWKIYQKTAN